MRGGATYRPRPKNHDRTQDWDWWWELNDDQYLRIKVATRNREQASSDSDTMLGTSGGDGISKVTAAEIRSRILPVVRIGMWDPFFDARAGAIIAVGKVADPSTPGIEDLRAEMRMRLADPVQQVAESACLGLGVLGDREGVPDLILVMKNAPEARARVAGGGKSDVPVRERAFAALALGLIGAQTPPDPGIVLELIEATKRDAAHADLQVFPILALGMLPSQSAVPELRRIARDSEASELVRAHAVVALGKLGDRGSVVWLVKEGLIDKEAQVARSAAIALGLLTDREDAKTVDALMAHAEAASDRAVRNFCTIALGQIGSLRARDFLVAQVRGGRPADRTFAALAIGIYGCRFKESTNDLGNVLLSAWSEVKSDSERGAYAIGMGLLAYKPAIPALMEVLKAAGSPELKGHAATALGLLGARQAIPLLQDLAKKTSDLDAQRRASVALGLVGDPDAVKLLLKVLENAGNNLSALGGASVALGLIGDRSAVPALSDMLLKRAAHKDHARAFAAVALGILGDKSELPLLSRVQESCNYLATTEGLNEVLLIY